MSKKVDRQKAKRAFLKHKSPTVKERRQEYSKKNQYTTIQDQVWKKTKGRSKEKEKLQSLATDQAQKEVIEETIAEIKELYKPTAEELAGMHKALVQLMKHGINTLTERANKKEILNPKEIREYWEMTKAEKLEPTKVNKIDAEGIQSGPAVIIVNERVNKIIGG